MSVKIQIPNPSSRFYDKNDYSDVKESIIEALQIPQGGEKIITISTSADFITLRENVGYNAKIFKRAKKGGVIEVTDALKQEITAFVTNKIAKVQEETLSSQKAHDMRELLLPVFDSVKEQFKELNLRIVYLDIHRGIEIDLYPPNEDRWSNIGECYIRHNGTITEPELTINERGKATIESIQKWIDSNLAHRTSLIEVATEIHKQLPQQFFSDDANK
jgi:hypothetical protein